MYFAQAHTCQRGLSKEWLTTYTAEVDDDEEENVDDAKVSEQSAEGAQKVARSLPFGAQTHTLLIRPRAPTITARIRDTQPDVLFEAFWEGKVAEPPPPMFELSILEIFEDSTSTVPAMQQTSVFLQIASQKVSKPMKRVDGVRAVRAKSKQKGLGAKKGEDEGQGATVKAMKAMKGLKAMKAMKAMKEVKAMKAKGPAKKSMKKAIKAMKEASVQKAKVSKGDSKVRT